MTFEPAPADGDLADAIDAAYRGKYNPSPYAGHMVASAARQATVRIRPQA